MGLPTIPIQALPPRSLFDIISFAFHRVGRQWQLLGFLAIPIVLICALLEALTNDIGLDLPMLQKASIEWYDFLHPDTARYYAHMIISVMALWGGAWFLNYLYLRTAVTDLTGGVLHRSFRQYLPDHTFWGYLGISLIQSLLALCVAGIVALGVVILVGVMAFLIKAPLLIALLVLISLALFTAVVIGFLIITIRLLLCSAFYFLQPADGILQAFRSSWAHSKSNWWRTLGFWMFLTLLLQIMLLPLFVIHGLVGMLTGSDLPGFKVIEPGIFRTLLLIIEQILWLSGTLFITQAATAYGKTRLALDLMTRHIRSKAKPKAEPTT